MPKKKISVGVSIAGDEVEYASLRSNTSLLDWDIIIFRPDPSEFLAWCSDSYMGKKSLDDDDSVAVMEAAKHWRNQLETALNEGKTAFVFLQAPVAFYVATGEKQYSGTGRNRKTTRIVTEFSSYKFFPIHTGWAAAEGAKMRLEPRASDILGSYWSTFEGQSKYQVMWEKNTSSACIHTKSGNRPVGFHQAYTNSGGALFLLPDLDFENTSFTTYDEVEDETQWTKEGADFARALISELVQICKNASAFTNKTAEPQWASDPIFEVPGESDVRSEILKVEKQIEILQGEIGTEIEKLRDTITLRDLLFENGKPLELAIIHALEVLGFNAESYDDGKSEFDVVFTCPEGRLLGEAEGKDNRQINISKLRQLSTNILEDVERDEVKEPAKGVLFGNSFRFHPPAERDACFTEKCIATASAISVALGANE